MNEKAQHHPDYWDFACEHLRQSDAIMGDLIAQFPAERLSSRQTPFSTLLYSIVGQQISVKAAASVWNKLLNQLKDMTPKAILAVTPETLRAAGLSARKVDYALGLARHFEGEREHMPYWQSKDDESILAELVSLRGIGRWTAEMFLIFCLMRPNVFPIDDLGVCKALMRHYFPADQQAITPARKKQWVAWAERFSPYKTVATWYLWRSLDPEAIRY